MQRDAPASSSWLRAIRAGLVLLTAAAILVQLTRSSDRAGFSAANFFSFFTVQSNILGAAVLATVAVRGARPRSRRLDLARGAATLYLAITGVVFALLLSHLQEDLQLTLPWVDTVLHRVMPLALVLDWLVDPPATRIPPRAALLWLAYPLAWIVFTLARGPSADWYPYPFVNVDLHGYPTVLATCAVMAVAFAAAALAVAAVGNRRGLRRQQGARAPSR